MIPSAATLKRLPFSQLAAVSNFTVGKRGVGQIRFLQPVDLTKLDVSSIVGRLIVFEPRQISVYPQSPSDQDEEEGEGEKPPPGQGLNLPAEIRLERSWPVSKATRQPIIDMDDELLKAHVERLRNQPDCHFIDYYPESGTWVFRVEHF